jgi:hypothetical protein
LSPAPDSDLHVAELAFPPCRLACLISLHPPVRLSLPPSPTSQAAFSASPPALYPSLGMKCGILRAASHLSSSLHRVFLRGLIRSHVSNMFTFSKLLIHISLSLSNFQIDKFFFGFSTQISLRIFRLQD